MAISESVHSEQVAEQALKARLAKGAIIETPGEMTEGYRKALRTFILIQVDNEIFTYFNYAPYWGLAPDRASRMATLSVLKDELAHINIGLHVLEDLGENVTKLLYERAPEQWRATYSTQVRLRDFVDLAVSIAFIDRAGAIVIEDGWHNCSYGPYRRSLRRAALDQRFHQTWGFHLMQIYAEHSDATRARLQESVDFFFPLSIEHFGTLDERGDRKYLDYRIKGKTSNEYRQIWLGQVVPFLDRIGIGVPCHREYERWVMDFDWPVEFDETEQRFLLDRRVDWSEVFGRWKRGGTGRVSTVAKVRQGGPAVLDGRAPAGA